jgi:nitrate/TMAO reductase-like tetraheme cytochrome c subunit
MNIAKIANVAYLLITLGLVLFVFLRAKKSGEGPRTKWWFLFAFGLLPVGALLISDSILLGEMKEVTFCGSCHQMEPFVKSLSDPGDSTLAAVHSKRHLIREQQCYTCHTDYALMGGAQAKLRGLRHLYAYYTKKEQKKPALYSPYPNANCLHCHAGAAKYEESPTHQTMLEELKKGETSCLDCHGPAHPGKEMAASE